MDTDVTIRPITFTRRRDGWLQSLGDAMQRHRSVIQAIQWTVVLFYLALVVYPAFLPLPPQYAHVYDNLTLFAQFVFWGIWWPFVMVSMMLIGRVWCGVFCPEGALTEFASRHGRGRAIPKWMRWGGWPFVAFAMTTVFGQLVSVYEYPKATLLVLGGSTVLAVGIGLVYGRSKRVWCRHLCPANGVFALLARLAPLHFAADDERCRTSTSGAQSTAGVWRGARRQASASARKCTGASRASRANTPLAGHRCRHQTRLPRPYTSPIPTAITVEPPSTSSVALGYS